MKFKMHERSLFALLLRSPWWVSILIGAAIGLLVRLVVPEDYRMYGYPAIGPFVAIGLYALYKELRAPGGARVAAVHSAVLGMSWREFSALIEAAFTRDGFGVTRIDLPAADFEIIKAGRVALVSAKRWKAASHGIGPLEELAALRRSREAAETMYISAGGLTDNAQRFATTEGMRVVNGIDLAVLLHDLRPPRAGQ